MPGLLVSFLIWQIATTPEPKDALQLPPLTVISARQSVLDASNSSLTRIARRQIEREAPTHPNELLDQVPGAWISRGSGQEHLTALRSPVLTGAGACGAVLVLEDQVAVRPGGFCNVNALFEVNIAQAEQVLVLRGPGTVIYGSNALHGVIDIRSPDPDPDSAATFGLEIGSDDYYRARLGLSTERFALHGSFTDAGSFRVDEQYQRALLNLVWISQSGKTDVRTQFSYAGLDQDTAGFIIGKDAYADSQLRVANLNPEAFRDADAVRLTRRWRWQDPSGNSYEWSAYARSSEMDFLQHFLPGTPLESNGQDSAGAAFSWSDNKAWSLGVDAEWAQGFLREFQRAPLTAGSAFLMETRPQGLHYDYAVKALSLAGWAQFRTDLRKNLVLVAGLRAESLNYIYDNLTLTGNTRDDGSTCGFGGCLYTRPADRSDRFNNLAPEFGLNWSLAKGRNLSLRLARGFRAPQATELYRLQSGQAVADLRSETLDAIELGSRGTTDRFSYELSLYAMKKEHFIFRDASGFNISNGRTRHAGVEALVGWAPSPRLRISSNLAYAKQKYDFDRALARGEVIRRGNEIDTAPRWLGALRLDWQQSDQLSWQTEWVHQGGYFLDAANAHRYGGHDLLNLRAFYQPRGSRFRYALRLSNITDKRYAERADFAFGAYRYFPGAGRRIFLNLEFRR